VRCQEGQFLDKLGNNCFNKHSYVTTVTFAPFKEETNAKVTFVVKFLGYSAQDCKLASARYTV
jgi:hypothetical protein